jgi:ABC-type sugar transport system ATPase subunit
VLLDVRDLVAPGLFEDINVTLRAGEIVGLAGLEGQGQREIARSLFGLERRARGNVHICGHAILPRHPRAAIRAGLVYLSDDRKGEELALPLPVRHNLSSSGLGQWAHGGIIDHRRERVVTGQFINDLRIRTAGNGLQLVSELSGGNQQKVVVGKRLATKPRVLIFDEPTRGIDVGAKLDIYTMMRDLAERGAALLVLSRDMIELIGLCDRLLVVAAGRVTRELHGTDMTEDAIMEAAIPRTAAEPMATPLVAAAELTAPARSQSRAEKS